MHICLLEKACCVATAGCRCRWCPLSSGHAGAWCRCRVPLQGAVAGCRCRVLLAGAGAAWLQIPLQRRCTAASGMLVCCRVLLPCALWSAAAVSLKLLGVLLVPLQCVARPVLLEGGAGAGARCRCRVLLGLTVQAVCALERALVLLRVPLQSSVRFGRGCWCRAGCRCRVCCC